MEFIDKIKTKIKEHQYIKYINEHRENVDKAFYEMVMNPDTDWINWNEKFCAELYDRVKTHDLSKYEPEEFDGYRQYYYPIDDIEYDLCGKNNMEKAWEHHWKNNRHHWQARQNDENIMTKEIQLDCLENVLDWMAMGYKFGDRPYQYYEKVKDEIKLPQAQQDFIERVIYEGVDKKYIHR